MRLFNQSEQTANFLKSFLIACIIPLYFILDANNQYWLLIPFESSIKIGLTVFFIIAGVFTFLQFFVRRESAVLIVCWLALNYLYFSIIYKAIASISFLSFLKQYKFYLPLLFFITVLYVFAMLKANVSSLKKLLSYVILLFLALLIFEGYKVARNVKAGAKTNILFKDKVILKPNKSSIRPDVFLIIMDEYAGFKPLTEYYHYNNAEFAKKLETMGFFVAKNPRSNYNGTLFSTLSLLNMTYLDTASIGDVKLPKAYAKVAKAIEENLLFDFFRNNGYKLKNNSFLRIKHTPTKPFLFLPVEDRLMMEKTFGYLMINNFMLNIKSNKLQQIAGTFYAEGDSYNQRVIKRIKKSTTDTASKLFIYTHLMMPHSPYLRDAQGRIRNFAEAHNELMKKKYDKPYINYLKYCNSVIADVTDSIVKNRRNVVIVLVSDHGNRFIENEHDQLDDFANFIAVYSTDNNYSGFTDSVSLVNVFRLIMKNQFAQKLELLPNRQINVVKGVLN